MASLCGVVVVDGMEEVPGALVEMGHLEIYRGGVGEIVRHRDVFRGDAEEIAHLDPGDAEETDRLGDEVATGLRPLDDEVGIDLHLQVCWVVVCCHLVAETEHCPGVCQGTVEGTAPPLEACQKEETGCYLVETALLPVVCQGLAVALVVH